MSSSDLIRRVALNTGRRISARDSRELLTEVLAMLQERETKETAHSTVAALSRLERQLLGSLLKQLEGDAGIVKISQMCVELGVSRSAFNRALRVLQASRVIDAESRGRSGTWINFLDADVARALRQAAV